MDRVSQSAFGSLIANLGTHEARDLSVEEWQPSIAVAVMACRGSESMVEKQLASIVASSDDAHLLATGPGMWLLLEGKVCGGRLEQLEIDFTKFANIFDQSSGFGFIRLRGVAARNLLQKAVFVDLDRELAVDGSSFCSVIAHVNVVAHRIASDTYGIAVPRSYAGSFWHWLLASAAAEKITLGR